MSKERYNKLRDKIHDKLDTGAGIKAFTGYTGVCNPLGYSTCYNSPASAKQLEFALVLSGHPLVQELIEDNSITPWNFNAEPLIDAKVLRGMKILDLGCGYEPTFARCARSLGGEVYTLDVIPANELNFYNDFEKGFTQRDRDVELEKHIEANLNHPNILGTIIKKAGKEFTLVTSAHLESGGGYNGKEFYPPYNTEEIAMSLLKPRGVYLKELFGEIKIK